MSSAASSVRFVLNDQDRVRFTDQTDHIMNQKILAVDWSWHVTRHQPRGILRFVVHLVCKSNTALVCEKNLSACMLLILKSSLFLACVQGRVDWNTVSFIAAHSNSFTVPFPQTRHNG